MRKIQVAHIELIDAVIGERVLDVISPALLEKDIHVTDALLAISKIIHDHTSFVFCGGTCLSKAHNLIERMSEDLDIKVVISESGGLNESEQRKHLSALKGKVIETMASIGFVEDAESRKALNGNKYFHSRWSYEPVYEYHGSLRPYLSIELTTRTPIYGTVAKPIGYLMDKLSGQPGATTNMECITVEETMAEKIISFLRRYAQHRAGELRQEWDSALVRHIYDIHCIHFQDGQAVKQAAKNFKELLDTDAKEFGRQYHPFAENPVAVLSDALARAENDDKCIIEYNKYLLPLVFGDIRPTYEEAFESFKYCAERLISSYYPHPDW